MLLKKDIFYSILKKDTFLSNAKWSVIGTLFSRVCALAVSYIIANELGSRTFGEYGIIQNTINTFSTFAVLGLGTASTISFASNSNNEDKRSIVFLSSIVSIASSVVLVIVMFIIAPWLSKTFLAAPHLANYIKIASIGLFGASINGIQQGILAGVKEFKGLSVINLISSSLLLVISLPLIKFFGLLGAVFYFTLTLIIPSVISIKYVKNALVDINIREINKSNWRIGWYALFNISIPAMLASFLVGPISWFCNTLLVQQPNGFFHLGIYNAALTWRMAVLFIPTALASVALSYFVSNSSNLKRSFLFNITLNAVIAVALSFGIWLFRELIMSGYGNDFEGYEDVLTLMAITTILMAINNVVGQVINSQKYLWTGLLFNLLWGISLLILVYYFVTLNNEGAMGMAKAQLLAYTAHTVWQGIFIYFKILRIQ